MRKSEVLVEPVPVRDCVRKMMSLRSLLPKASTLSAFKLPALMTLTAPSNTCTSDNSKLPALLSKMSPTSVKPMTASLIWVFKTMPKAALA
ncbi:hypothetical protein MCEMAEM4_03379 [Burkholderiaceae bacterium]